MKAFKKSKGPKFGLDRSESEDDPRPKQSGDNQNGTPGEYNWLSKNILLS